MLTKICNNLPHLPLLGSTKIIICLHAFHYRLRNKLPQHINELEVIFPVHNIISCRLIKFLEELKKI